MIRREGKNQWIDGIAARFLPRPKNFGLQKSAGKFLASFFLGSSRHPTHLLPSKVPNCQPAVLLMPVGATEGHSEGKTLRRGKVTKWVLFLHGNAPADRALATQKKLAYLGFHCLVHPPYSPDMAPSDSNLLT